jgi:hypothetical protein
MANMNHCGVTFKIHASTMVMASYVEKQLFKTRFWKHIWSLDPE